MTAVDVRPVQDELEQALLEPPPRRSAWKSFLVEVIGPFIVFWIVIGVWYFISYRLLKPHRRFLMPPPHRVLDVAFLNSRNRNELLQGLWSSTKVAMVGLAIAIVLGMLFAILMSQAKWIERSLFPYAVVLQTIPILALAPIVVVGLGNVSIVGWTPKDWMRVAVIAAYLTFFPVTVNTVRGLRSADPAAVELMESYAAREWSVFWKLRVPAAMPYLFSAFKVAATACVVGAIIGELPSSIQDGLGGWITNFNQYYALQPENLWAVNLVAALLGISFFLVVVLVEKLVVHRAFDDRARADLETRYASARRARPSPRQWASVKDHIWFLWTMTGDESLPCHDGTSSAALQKLHESLRA